MGAADPKLPFEAVDPPGHPPPVDLALGLTRAPGADAAGLLAEPGAHPPEPGQAVVEQGQLDLRLALRTVGVLGEDVEDHRRAVDGGATQQLLEVELLGRCELVVEHDRVAVRLEGHGLQLVDLAPADVVGGVGRVPALDDPGDHVGAGGVDELLELVEGRVGLLGGRGRYGHPHEDDPFPKRPVDQRDGVTLADSR